MYNRVKTRILEIRHRQNLAPDAPLSLGAQALVDFMYLIVESGGGGMQEKLGELHFKREETHPMAELERRLKIAGKPVVNEDAIREVAILIEMHLPTLPSKYRPMAEYIHDSMCPQLGIDRPGVNIFSTVGSQVLAAKTSRGKNELQIAEMVKDANLHLEAGLRQFGYALEMGSDYFSKLSVDVQYLKSLTQEELLMVMNVAVALTDFFPELARDFQVFKSNITKKLPLPNYGEMHDLEVSMNQFALRLESNASAYVMQLHEIIKEKTKR
jgi:hypothetical protein